MPQGFSERLSLGRETPPPPILKTRLKFPDVVQNIGLFGLIFRKKTSPQPYKHMGGRRGGFTRPHGRAIWLLYADF